MAKTSEALVWGDLKYEMMGYLEFSESPDDWLGWQMLFDAALNDADEYLNNDFVDADGEDLEFPTLVKIGVYEWVKTSTQMPSVSGLEREKVGDLEAEYNPRLVMTFETIYKRFWERYKLLDWSVWDDE